MKKAFSLILVALFSTVFALAQETVTYQPAQYPAGMGELHKFIAQNLRADARLFSQMEKEGIKEVTATFGLIINSKGKLVAIDLMQTSHPKFNENYFNQLIKLLKKEEFIPGTINGEPAATSIIIKGFTTGTMGSITGSIRKERGSTNNIRDNRTISIRR
ncbi:MAG: hypothetical protein IKY99_00205 [Bacteroidaceae bacterium]|nr:hypothetical protein [Bacteroidaceae bacterium]